jgi:hypothetical protein
LLYKALARLTAQLHTQPQTHQRKRAPVGIDSIGPAMGFVPDEGRIHWRRPTCQSHFSLTTKPADHTFRIAFFVRFIGLGDE